MTDCQRKGKWIGGCNFEPRYDLSEPDLSRFKTFKSRNVAEFLDALRKKTYVKDVCITCGKSVMRRDRED